MTKISLAVIAALPFLGFGAVRCDVNLDGTLDANDAAAVVQSILSPTPSVDVNGDGACNVTDLQIVVNAAISGNCPVFNVAPRQPFRYVAIADPHLFSRERSARFMADFARTLEKAKELGADFVVILGDLPGTEPISTVFEQAKEIIEAAPIKVYLVRGNHDERPIYERTFGTSDYHFDHKGHRFVGVDDQTSLNPAYSRLPLHIGITSAPSDMPITIWRHRVPTIDEIPVLTQFKNVKTSFGAHLHYLSDQLVQGLRRVTLDDWHGTYTYTVVDVAADGTSRLTHNRLP